MSVQKYFFCCLIGLASNGVSAQQTAEPIRIDNISTEYPKPSLEVQPFEKALGFEIWSDDFNNAANWTFDNDGQSGVEFGWSIDSTVNSWWPGGGINSNSGGSFAELSNGDPFINGQGNIGNQALGVKYTMTSIALDIPSLPGNIGYTDQVTLQYQESGARLNDRQEVQISVNGIDWVTIRNNEDYHPTLSTMVGSAFPNPTNVSINLAPFITSNASQVQIRFLWTTNHPDLASNASVWVAYGWYLDDVKLFTNPDNDIRVEQAFWGTAGLNYTMIPKTQVAPIYFHANAINSGLNVQNDVQLSVNVNTGVWSGDSPSETINVGDYDSLVLTTQFTPAQLPGIYNISWDLTQLEADDIPSNNSIQNESFEVTDFIYAHDDNTIDGYRNNIGEAYELGNFFDIWEDQTAYYIDVKLHDSTNIGSVVYGKIYSWDNSVVSEDFSDHLVFEQQSQYHTVNASDLNGVLSLPLLFPYNLEDSKTRYFVVLATNGDAGASADVVCATSGISPEGFSFFHNGTDWFKQFTTPIVRLNFNGIYWGLAESIESLSEIKAFPNPANDVIKIRYDLEHSSDISMEIVDMNGIIVNYFKKESKNSGPQEKVLDISELSPGVYYARILGCEKLSQIKFCVALF
jgi:hypothetical protein